MQEYNNVHGIVDKPKTAFQHFKEENTETLKSEFPDISKKEIHLKLQKRWKELQSEKCDTVKKYINMANKVENKVDGKVGDKVDGKVDDKVDDNDEDPPKSAIKKKRKDKDLTSSKKKTPVPTSAA